MFGKPSKLVSAFLEIPQLDGLPCLKAVTHSIYVFAFDRSCEPRRYLLLSTFRRSSLKSTWSLQLIKWMSSECVWVCVNKCEYLYIQYETLAPPHGRSINQVYTYTCTYAYECVCVCVWNRAHQLQLIWIYLNTLDSRCRKKYSSCFPISISIHQSIKCT